MGSPIPESPARPGGPEPAKDEPGAGEHLLFGDGTRYDPLRDPRLDSAMSIIFRDVLNRVGLLMAGM